MQWFSKMDPWSTSLLLISDKTNRLCMAHKRIYQRCDCEGTKKNVISDKNITHFLQKVLDLAIKQTQNSTVFLATAQKLSFYVSKSTCDTE
jgi:hypothetical protein